MLSQASRPSAPRVMRGVGQSTRQGVFSEHNHGPEHLRARWLRAGGGSGHVRTASTRLRSLHVWRWSEIVPQSFAGLARLAAPPSSQGSRANRSKGPPRITTRGRAFRCGEVARPFHLRRWLPRERRTLRAVVNRRAVTEGGVAARDVVVKDLLSNKRINATHFAASRRLLAQASRRSSCARYAQR